MDIVAVIPGEVVLRYDLAVLDLILVIRLVVYVIEDMKHFLLGRLMEPDPIRRSVEEGAVLEDGMLATELEGGNRTAEKLITASGWRSVGKNAGSAYACGALGGPRARRIVLGRHQGATGVHRPQECRNRC